jgi:hypothetical protein
MAAPAIIEPVAVLIVLNDRDRLDEPAMLPAKPKEVVMKRLGAFVLTAVLALAASPALAQNDGHMMGDHDQGMMGDNDHSKGLMDDGDHGQGMMGDDGHGQGMDDGDHGQGMMGDDDGHGMTDHHDQ